jgi:hypothetical protein
MTTFVCQNSQMLLFGPSREQWSILSASMLLNALVKLWNEW